MSDETAVAGAIDAISAHVVTPRDWVRLALAALGRAGVDAAALRRVEALACSSIGLSVGGLRTVRARSVVETALVELSHAWRERDELQKKFPTPADRLSSEFRSGWLEVEARFLEAVTVLRRLGDACLRIS